MDRRWTVASVRLLPRGVDGRTVDSQAQSSCSKAPRTTITAFGFAFSPRKFHPLSRSADSVCSCDTLCTSVNPCSGCVRTKRYRANTRSRLPSRQQELRAVSRVKDFVTGQMPSFIVGQHNQANMGRSADAHGCTDAQPDFFAHTVCAKSARNKANRKRYCANQNG